MQVLGFQSTILIALNILQMVLILLLLLPIFDIITLSKNIRLNIEHFKESPLFPTLTIMYVMIIAGYGIIGPTRILNNLKISKIVKQNATPREKLIRIIDSASATRNYLLGGLSLFYVLVIWRLLDYVQFSAKLHEFSDLMGNYDLVDITSTTEAETAESADITYIIDEAIDDDSYVQWPSIADLSKRERIRIRSFFKDAPKKSKTSADKETESISVGATDSNITGTTTETKSNQTNPPAADRQKDTDKKST